MVALVLQLNNSRVSLASWSPGPSARSAASSPATSPHTPPPPLSSEDMVRNNPAVFLNNHQNALKVRRNFISNSSSGGRVESQQHQQHQPVAWPLQHGLQHAKLHPLRNALGYPLPGVALVCNNHLGSQLGQLAQLGAGEDPITTKKPCRCPPEEPLHEYSSIIGPPPHLPHKAASTEPLYWSPILKRAAGGGGVGPGGGGGGNNPQQGEEGTLKKGWSGTSRVFKYIVQRRGRPRRGWRWLLWLLGAGAVTLLMAIGLAAYLTSGKAQHSTVRAGPRLDVNDSGVNVLLSASLAGFGLLRSTEAALRSNGESDTARSNK